LNPPTECIDFHRDSLANLKESLDLMRGMKQALDTSDTGALTNLAGKAKTLYTRAEVLQRNEEALRKKFGIPNP
jgi:hypothetical protein